MHAFGSSWIMMELTDFFVMRWIWSADLDGNNVTRWTVPWPLSSMTMWRRQNLKTRSKLTAALTSGGWNWQTQVGSWEKERECLQIQMNSNEWKKSELIPFSSPFLSWSTLSSSPTFLPVLHLATKPGENQNLHLALWCGWCSVLVYRGPFFLSGLHLILGDKWSVHLLVKRIIFIVISFRFFFVQLLKQEQAPLSF